MNISELFQVIGELYVERCLLRQRIAELEAAQRDDVPTAEPEE